MRPTTTLSIFATTASSGFPILADRIFLTFGLDFGDILLIARSEASSVNIFRVRRMSSVPSCSRD